MYVQTYTHHIKYYTNGRVRGKYCAENARTGNYISLDPFFTSFPFLKSSETNDILNNQLL